MSGACTPGLVGVASFVSVIWLPFKNSQFSLEKFNRSESAQKFYAGRG